jgi:hypothetical protein
VNGFKAATRPARAVRALVESLEDRRLLSSSPSLAAILRQDQIPTIVGDGPNDAYAFSGPAYPTTPDPSTQEVAMPRLQKAGNGPVTITLLASFDVSNQPALRFGYYTPGDPTDTTELFGLNQSESQSLNPVAQGATNFDPGTASFGLYADFPAFTANGQDRISYSEDSLNTWDTAQTRKIRFLPLENPDGSVVANSFVFAVEENTTSYTFTSLVGIISNVKAAPGGAVLGLTNLSGAPSTTRLVFNRIQNVNPSDPGGFTDIVHDQNTVRIQNTGNQTLTITALNLSDANWQLVNPPSLPLNLAAGASTTITIKFVATTDPAHSGNQTNDTTTTNGLTVNAAGGVATGTLTIQSNDLLRTSLAIQLAGYWQDMSESENEPGLATIANLMFGYGTNIGASGPDLPNNGTTPLYYGEELPSAYWYAADPTQPVSVLQLAAWHNQFISGTTTLKTAQIGWYSQGSGTINWLFAHQGGESQSLFPTINGSTTQAAAGSFTPTGAFGWNLDGQNSVDSANTADIALGRSGHAVRFFPVGDGSGNIVPNTWLAVEDYQSTEFANSDFQDNVYLVSNMRPATQAPAPTGAQAFGANGGVQLQWIPASDTNLLGYNVYRSDSPSGPFVKLDTSPIPSFNYLDTTAPSAAVSYYRITAVDSAGESEAGNLSAVPAPAAPSSLVASTVSTSQINLNWTDNSVDETGFLVERSTDGIYFMQIATVGADVTTYADSGLTPNTTYTYRVRATNAAGTSLYSNTSSATTLASHIDPPPTFDVTLGAGGAKSIHFTDPDGTLATLTWSGPGSAVVHFSGASLSDTLNRKTTTVNGVAAIAGINVSSTKSTSSLTVLTHGGNNSIDIANFAANSSFGRLVAKTSTLSGTLSIAGSASAVLVGSMADLSATFGGNLIFLSTARSDNTTLAAAAIKSIALGAIPAARSSNPVGITAHRIDSIAGAVGANKFSLHHLTPVSNPQALLAARNISTAEVVIQLD